MRHGKMSGLEFSMNEQKFSPLDTALSIAFFLIGMVVFVKIILLIGWGL